MVAGIVVRRENVEYCSQELKSKRSAVGGGGRNGSAEIRCDLGKEHRGVGCLSDEVNQEVIGGRELFEKVNLCL